MPAEINGGAGRWVLVTGASSGIGLHLAQEFAAHGYKLLLLGRNSEKLRHVADDLVKINNASVEVIVQDLSARDAVVRVVEFLEKRRIEVEILVNNAGFGMHGEFYANDAAKIKEMVDVHVGAFLELTRHIAAGMRSRGSGRILNVSSVYAFSPVPRQAVYSATKAFMYFFSEVLREELKGSGVSVTVLCPGITRTAFRERMGFSELRQARGMEAQRVARYAYRDLLERRFLSIPGFANKLYVFASRLLPHSWMMHIISIINQWRGLDRKNAPA